MKRHFSSLISASFRPLPQHLPWEVRKRATPTIGEEIVEELTLLVAKCLYL